MGRRLSRALIVTGLLVAGGAAIWWYAELTGRLGSFPAWDAMRCLAQAGTGNCGLLWFAGLHASNQIASLLFYAGVVAVIFGAFLRPSADEDDYFGPGPAP